MTNQVYIVSNRDFNSAQGTDYPNLDNKGKSLTYLTSPYDPTKNSAGQSDWLTAVNAGTHNRTMIFIHGYGNSWDKVTGKNNTKPNVVDMVSNFWNKTTTPYPGPIVLFDWPSVGGYKVVKDTLATPTAMNSFPLLKDIISGISGKVDVVCHSMGNFVMQRGASALGTDGIIDQCLINAAAIANDSFGSSSSQSYAKDILNCCERVTAYWTKHDNTLLLGESSLADGWKELGREGPTYASPADPKFFGVDCTTVLTTPVPPKSDGGLVHTSYYYVPQVLDDFIATLGGADEAKVANRTATSAQAFTMNPVKVPTSAS